MTDPMKAPLQKWPFFAANILLFGMAVLIFYQAPAPRSVAALSLSAACIALGGLLSVIPFLLEYHALTRLAEAQSLSAAATQIRNLERLATQIESATAQWQTVQDQATQTANDVKHVTTRMTHEAKAFAQFIEGTNDSEKATLRLEVEKLRRAENEAMLVLVRMLDHVYALHQGALRSRQAGLIDQVTRFQQACRDVARRVGLTPFVPVIDERFDGQRHQVPEGNGDRPIEPGLIAETLAPGYTFQSKLLRPAMVRLQQNEEKDHAPAMAEAAGEQSQLPLGTIQS